MKALAQTPRPLASVRQAKCSTARGLVFDIQRTALHDGPGIRTTVFVKGCPLRCAWCHNPESQSLSPEILHDSKGSSRQVGTPMSVGEVMAILERDKPYFEASGGGLTISGGEPMASFEFTRALLAAARNAGIHTCLDTSGAAPVERYLAVAREVDLFLWDVKLSNAEDSRKYVGLPPETLWSGLRVVGRAGASAILRCPIVPGLNDNVWHFDAIRALATTVPGIREVHLIPYHRLGRSKREQLGLTDTFSASTPRAGQVESWLNQLRERINVPVSLG